MSKAQSQFSILLCRWEILQVLCPWYPNLLVALVVLGHDAGGQGGDEDGEVLHFVCKESFMSAQQILQVKDRIVIIMNAGSELDGDGQ